MHTQDYGLSPEQHEAMVQVSDAVNAAAATFPDGSDWHWAFRSVESTLVRTLERHAGVMVPPPCRVPGFRWTLAPEGVDTGA